MSLLSAIPIVGKILDGVIGLVDKAVLDKDEAERLKVQLTEVFNKSDLERFTTEIKAQADVIMTEATGQSWLQRNWRPGLMALFGLIIFNNYVLNPWLCALFSLDVMMEIPPDMWALLKLGVGGYIVGRSTEKAVEVWKQK